MPDNDDALTNAAAEAFRLTRFHADVYESAPTRASDVAFLDVSAYHHAASLLDCIVDVEAIIGILPPYYRDASRFPFTVPEDEAELVLRQRRIVRALTDLGVDFDACPRFLIVTDERRGPFACELAKGFYWEGFQTSLCFLDGSADELRREVDIHEPDYVVLTSGRRLRHVLECPRHTIWLTETCGETPLDAPEYPTLLYADAVDLIGSRAPGRAGFDHDADQLLLEVNPATGLSHVTKPRFTCFPLVRFGLGRYVPTAAMLASGVS